MASAQITVGPATTGGGPLTCTATPASPTQVRAEGHAELLGDILIICQGGLPPAIGSVVPTANITVALANLNVTSRTLSNGLSEALLLIDEPGATGAGAATGPGTAFPQVLCTGGAVGAGPGGCVTTVTTVTPPGGAFPATTVAALAGTTTVPTVFQGFTPPGAPNQVVFNGIPLLAPVTGGSARFFRITNLRGDVAAVGTTGFTGTTTINAFISLSGTTTTLNSTAILPVANVFNGLNVNPANSNGARNAGGGTLNATTGISVLQCNTAGLTTGSVLRFAEGFAAAFKTRIAPTTSISGAGTASAGVVINGTFNQNIPGALFTGSESGFIFNTGSGVAGLADFGTRLKATFTNVPSGITIFVSTTNINPFGNTGVNINTSPNTGALANLLSSTGTIPSTNNATVSFLAALVSSENAPEPAGGGFLPLVTTTNTANQIQLAAITPDASGTATATWEVLLANPNAFETAEFAVFFTVNSNPANNLPATNGAATVALSFAPTSTTTGSTTTSPIPRFIPGPTPQPFVSIVTCSTVLLFPWVSTSAANSFDTGLAISNTSSDNFGTNKQSGTCTIQFFSASGAPTGPQPFPHGTTSTTIAAGTTVADSASAYNTGAAGFTGYAIAVCNFQLAHGYALFSDIGIRNWATGYLALVLPTSTASRNGANIQVGPGSAGAVEGLGQ